MKKILISLSIIGVIAAGVIGITIAYFNDTETSAGNIFVAGTIDLKVDHKYSMYNGKECTSECVEQLGTDLMRNGSFEVPEVTHSSNWQIFPSGTSGLEWTVEWADASANTYQTQTRPAPALVEYHESIMGPAKDGDQYAELDSDWFGPDNPLNGEPALIQIYQNIATTIGTKYKLHYYYAPRPNTPAGENILYVEINDANVATHNMAGGGGNIVWAEYTYEFTATTTSTKVEFVGGGTNNSLGIFLDHVTLHPYVCNYQVIGGSCKLWEEKDLTDGDYFWNYGDIKPGDYGTNIISLHAYSNDAFACLITHNIQDQENTLVDPEVALSDTSLTGELSQFIETFAWEDVNQNNVYDAGDIVISGPGVPLTTALGIIPLTASNTKYIGLAWCVGDQTLSGYNIVCNGAPVTDIAQTDSFTAFITAYIEQQRNNAGFKCADLKLVD